MYHLNEETIKSQPVFIIKRLRTASEFSSTQSTCVQQPILTRHCSVTSTGSIMCQKWVLHIHIASASVSGFLSFVSDWHSIKTNHQGNVSKMEKWIKRIKPEQPQLEKWGVYLWSCTEIRKATPTACSTTVSTLPLCQTALWPMVAIPVHQDPVPSVTWHLIIIISQESLFKKSRHALEFRCTLLFSQPHLCPDWAAHTSALSFEVSLVHPTWDYLISSHI